MNHLLFGKERFLKEQFIAGLKKEIFPEPSSAEMNFQMFRAPKDALSGVTAFLETAPFLASKRMAVLWGIEELDEEDQERLAGWLKTPRPNSVLVLETEATNVKKDAFLEELSALAKTTACHPPFEKDLPGWIDQTARKRGLLLERGASQELAGQGRTDLALLDAQLSQLALFVHPKKSVRVEDVQALLKKNSDEDVYRLTDMVLDGRKKEALVAVGSLYDQGVRGPEMIGAIASQLEKYRKAHAARKMGQPTPQIGEELRIHRMHQGAFFSRLDRLPAEKLTRLTRELLACDVAFKTGQTAERLSVERFILTS